MSRKAKLKLFPKYSSRFIYIGAIALAIFGSFMIVSAEMGESTADLSVISSTTIKQLISLALGITCLIIITKIRLVTFRIQVIWIGYFVVMGMLLATRLFSPIGGAYGWLWFGPISVQPSEFAKLYVILLAAKLFDKDVPKLNMNRFEKYALSVLAYVFIVFKIQNDLGSAVVILGIGFVCMLIPPFKEYRKYQNWMILALIAGVVVTIVLLLPLGTKLLENLGDSYKVNRFLASADPFAYQYDSGYHLVMSLVSFATGGLFGLGYSKSIHKYMNFPNPSTDFILPVIIEENGIIFGLIPILVLYGFILAPLAYHSIKCESTSGKIMMVGPLIYFVLHFILNVGGVSGFIPLTGVPLLLISSGRSSLISCLATLGMAESEIIFYQKNLNNENSIG